MRALRVGGPLVVAAALLLWAAPRGVAQDEAEVLALRIVSMKASGKREGDVEPRSDEKVRAYLPVLKPLGYDYYRGANAHLQRAGQGKTARFTENLPLQFQAQASWKRTGKDALELVVVLDRPDRKGKLNQVLKATVQTRDGQHFVIRVTGAYPDGDLVLLMTAQGESP